MTTALAARSAPHDPLAGVRATGDDAVHVAPARRTAGVEEDRRDAPVARSRHAPGTATHHRRVAVRRAGLPYGPADSAPCHRP
ncbi:hypothetical protein AB0K80_25925 [Streptomyces sp. NPDC052682]|uniref:hypothetical protein n=1 Tax=Streptomyces sp. NPDC052682 TaxID=3154954 RepID=UPI00342AEC3D